MANYNVKIDEKKGKFYVEGDLVAPYLSSSGKTNIRFTTGGFQKIDGSDMKINLTINEPIKRTA